MKELWKITLFEYEEGGFAVRITGCGNSSKGKGRTPFEAYRNAEIKLIIKPAFFIDPNSEGRQ